MEGYDSFRWYNDCITSKHEEIKRLKKKIQELETENKNLREQLRLAEEVKYGTGEH